MQDSVTVISSHCSMYGHPGAQWKVWSCSEVTGGPNGGQTARSEASVEVAQRHRSPLRKSCDVTVCGCFMFCTAASEAAGLMGLNVFSYLWGEMGASGIVMVDLRGQDECLCIHLIHTSLMCLENLNTLTSKVIKHMINAAFSGESMSLEKRVAVQNPVRGLPGSQTSDQRAAI